jgi:L-threonylcarbamoyladenylate synthase
MMDGSQEAVSTANTPPNPPSRADAILRIPMPNDPAEYACRLYTALHHVDATGFGRLLVEAPPTRSAWLAVNDQLRRGQTG